MLQYVEAVLKEHKRRLDRIDEQLPFGLGFDSADSAQRYALAFDRIVEVRLFILPAFWNPLHQSLTIR